MNSRKYRFLVVLITIIFWGCSPFYGHDNPVDNEHKDTPEEAAAKCEWAIDTVSYSSTVSVLEIKVIQIGNGKVLSNKLIGLLESLSDSVDIPDDTVYGGWESRFLPLDGYIIYNSTFSMFFYIYPNNLPSRADFILHLSAYDYRWDLPFNYEFE